MASVLLLCSAAPGPTAGDPAFLHDLLATLDGQRAGGDILGHHGAGGDERVRADGDSRHHATIAPDEGAVADRRLVLVDAVVVHDDHAGADIHSVATGRVADIREVARLGPSSDARFLDLHEVADPGGRADMGLRAKVTEGT